MVLMMSSLNGVNIPLRIVDVVIDLPERQAESASERDPQAEPRLAQASTP
jgi:hypothetical protein